MCVGSNPGTPFAGWRARVLAESSGQRGGERVVQRSALGVGGAHSEGAATGLRASGSAAAPTYRLARQKTLPPGE
ncbi:hypothetical protein K0M31_013561 [Melipona bicolor]|uniref:Uncharacterized protein n=1 Tax=Melipona bicolor TaxID=60889 RepID=A0AA40FHA5_9HYME|nr:hypothetical protein K0M31_013561 [Melipona bicolor]